MPIAAWVRFLVRDRCPLTQNRTAVTGASHGLGSDADASVIGSYRDSVAGLSAYDRHKKFIADYVRFYGGRGGAGGGNSGTQLPARTDLDTLWETYRFIRSENDDADGTWEQRLARRYHDKLFKEYCIADMSRYKENKARFWHLHPWLWMQWAALLTRHAVRICVPLNAKATPASILLQIGMRWRVAKEVVLGKGQFVCGSKGCDERAGLHSYEALRIDIEWILIENVALLSKSVNFAYKEAGEEKQALVKLRICPKHAYQLNYRKEKERERAQRRERKKLKRKKLKTDDDGHREEAAGVRRATHDDAGSSASSEGDDGENGDVPGAEGGAADCGDGREVGGKLPPQRGGPPLSADESIWLGKPAELEPSRDEEFDEYFKGMFL
eukprot:SM000137S00474  [mRNA]  locus=s137:305665:309290:+ [translate_table: standard]